MSKRILLHILSVYEKNVCVCVCVWDSLPLQCFLKFMSPECAADVMLCKPGKHKICVNQENIFCGRVNPHPPTNSPVSSQNQIAAVMLPSYFDLCDADIPPCL